MICGIYKIENLVNNKVYIGQSKNVRRRLVQHRRGQSEHSLLRYDILTYTPMNFSYELLEECSEDELLEKESYYILKFNSLYPNGYNQAVILDGKFNIFSKYSLITLNDIINDIKNSDTSFKIIADRYNLHISTIYNINKGSYHAIGCIKYPIRELNNTDIPSISYRCPICGKDKCYDAKLCMSCSREKSRKVTRPSRDELMNAIKDNSFVSVGKLYGVSDNAVRKWCKYYNIPYKKKNN